MLNLFHSGLINGSTWYQEVEPHNTNIIRKIFTVETLSKILNKDIYQRIKRKYTAVVFIMFRCAPSITTVSNLGRFSRSDTDDSASYLTMAARGIHECTLDSFFTVNVPKEDDYIDFSHSFSQIGSDFSFGLSCDNHRQTKSPVFSRRTESVTSTMDQKYVKLSKTKQKYVVNSNELKNNNDEKDKRLTSKLRLKMNSWIQKYFMRITGAWVPSRSA